MSSRSYKYFMKTKLELFKNRNQKRNLHLYQTSQVEGYDYVVCPVSGERLSMIKDNYIVKILGMPVTAYPAVQRICNKRKENIKAGLKQIDAVSGLTKYELSQKKSQAVLRAVGKDGISGYKKKGEKTRATHMANVDAMGRNGYSQLATTAIITGNATKVARGKILDPASRSKFYWYKSVVTYLTNRHKATLTKGIKTGLAGTEGAFQIDHRYSVMHGFVNGVSPLVIGHIRNLEMLPWKTNLVKHSSSSVSLDELLSATGYELSQSSLEFINVMTIIDDCMTSGKHAFGGKIVEKLYESTIRSEH